jgi:hypothetical protein
MDRDLPIRNGGTWNRCFRHNMIYS